MSEPTTLIFLPGWGFKSSIFEQSAQYFKNSHLLDLPILTDNPNEEMIADLLKTRIPENAIIIAWSLSALLVLCLLKKYPHHIQKLIALHCSPCFSAQSDWPGISSANQILFKKFYDKNSFLRKIFYNDILFPNASDNFFIDLEKHQSMDFSSWRYYLNVLFQFDLRRDLTQIGDKVIFILGDKDKIVPFDIMACLAEKVTYKILNNCGHASFLTHPDEFLNTLKSCLNHEYH